MYPIALTEAGALFASPIFKSILSEKLLNKWIDAYFTILYSSIKSSIVLLLAFATSS